MYYTQTPQANVNQQNDRPQNAQVQDWSRQAGRDQARQAADRQMAGWQAIDAQDDGDDYKVHVRDGSGRLKTVVMGRDHNIRQTMDGYC